MNNNSPYNLTENNLEPGLHFDSTGGAQNVLFKNNINDQAEQGIEVEFDGELISQSCDLQSQDDDLKRKYHVSGLFPVCDSSLYECLNFNISYTSNAPLNINEFKTRMAENASEILGPEATPSDILNYQNSLYYYRRYKDNEGKINIEGQIKCDNDSESPFHCEIFNEEVSDGYLMNEDKACMPSGRRSAGSSGSLIGGEVNGTIDDAKSACNDNATCSGFTYKTSMFGNNYQLVESINQVDVHGIGDEQSFCYQKL